MTDKMFDTGIASLIRHILISDFLGKKNAQHRGVLLGRIRYHEPGIKDRRMRKIYGQILPIGWCDKGIYVIDSIEEVERMIQTEESRRDSIDEKIEGFKRHKAYLVQRQKEQETGQRSLFG